MDNIQDVLTLIYLCNVRRRLGNTKNMYLQRTYVKKISKPTIAEILLSAPKGASAFIDFGYSSVLKYGAR